MMRTIYLQNKRSPKKTQWVILVFAAMFVFGYFFAAPIGNFLGGALTVVSSPFLKTGNWISEKAGSLLMRLEDKNNILEDNRFLQNEIDILNYKLSENNSLREENLALKKLMGRDTPETNFSFEDAFSAKTVVAAVLAGPVVSPYDSLVLDVGADKGILSGRLVFTTPGIAVGKIFSVSAGSSKARLFSSYGVKTSVFLGKNMVEITGMGGGEFLLDVPKNFMISVSDIAVLPGISMVSVARVVSIYDDPKDTFKRVILKSPINVKEFRFVAISKW